LLSRASAICPAVSGCGSPPFLRESALKKVQGALAHQQRLAHAA
jgi:hypothetical protein